jgi:diguanylate cyclase (GGDEF)-like protein
MIRTKTIPALVVLLSLAAIASITLLQARAGDGRDAQLKLATLKTELTQLQLAPFKASERTGGSPELARKLIDDGKHKVAATLAELRRSSPVPALARIQAPLRADYAAIDEIYAIGASGADYGKRADRLAGVSGRSMGAISVALDEASRAYDRRASAADSRATAGSAAAIFLLALAFVFLYRRAALARAVAERLARENARMAAASHEEARTDALTGLPNRRALIDDLDAALAQAGDKRGVLVALFDLDGFKQYNDTFGHQAGDTLLTRLGDRLGTAVDGIGSAYRMGGDEFCVLASVEPARAETVVALAAAALSDAGDGFVIDCSHGQALVPSEAFSPADALRLADQRMYAQKASPSSASRQSTDVLLEVLSERDSELRSHLSTVSGLAERIAERLGLDAPEIKLISLRGEAPRRGQDGDPRRDPQQAGPARSGGVGVHAQPHGDRRADHPRGTVARAERRPRSLEPRAVRRHGLPRRAGRRRDPARRQHHRRLRRLRRDGVAAPVSRRHVTCRRRCRATPLRRHAVRPTRRRGLLCSRRRERHCGARGLGTVAAVASGAALAA